MAGVRSRVAWSEADVRLEAAKYATKSAFNAGAGGAYEWARRHKIIDEIFEGRFNRWDETTVRLEASKYGSRSDFSRGSPSAYAWSLKHGIIEELIDHEYRRWDADAVRLEAAKYTRITDFAKGSSQAYSLARTYGIVGDLFTSLRVPWTEDMVRLEASKYLSKEEFKEACGGAHKWALRHKILDDLFENQLTKWDEASVRLIAQEFSTKSEFKQSSRGAWGFARKNGFLEDLGFTSKAYTFSSTSPASLYVVDTVLTDGAPAIMFGITNRRQPAGRYSAMDISKMTNRLAYRFPKGAHARDAENNLLTEFAAYRIKRGTSPFEEKTGGSGEIIYATAVRGALENLIQENHPSVKSVFSW